MRKRIALLGDVNLDLVLPVSGFPAPGAEELSERAFLALGGSVVHTARWLSLFGVEVRLAGCVGMDPWGEWVLTALRRAGIGTRYIQRADRTPTGIMCIAVGPGGERTMLGARGANAELRAGSIPPGWLEGVEWLHLSGYAWLRDPQRAAAEWALAEARRRGIPVSLDVGLGAACLKGATLRSLLPRVDLLLPSREEARRLSGRNAPAEALQELSALVPGPVLIKLGGEGCLVPGERGPVHLPPFPVAARDTTGAGDAFDAGAIIGALQDWSPALQGLLGNLLGALSAGGGPADPWPTEKEALRLIDRLAERAPPWQANLEMLKEFVQSHWEGGEDGSGLEGADGGPAAPVP
ncbi:MAG: PfkB domain protein [Acetothermia bacterium 64_32]|nr:MAG: PfkB domain protein [Acetothermia bacterium 64_32]